MHSRVWNTSEAAPDDNDQVSAGAGEIRNHMVDVKERAVLDHIWGSSTATDGYHTTVHLQGRGDNPTALASYALLFAKTGTAGAIELYVSESGTQVTQITKEGYLYLSDARLDNNSYIIATNSAGSANINMWKVDGSNLIVAGTTLSSTTMVPPLIMSTTGANTNLNADLTDFYHSSLTPSSNTIMVSDTAGKCTPYLKSYDSGWFAVGLSGSYSKTHSLGTTKIISKLWFSASSDGSDAIEINQQHATDMGARIESLTTTTLIVKTPPSHLLDTAIGASSWYDSGYLRVVMLALE